LDRHGVESSDTVGVAQGYVRLGEDLPRARVVLVPGRLVDGFALGAGAGAELLVDGPVHGVADRWGERRHAGGRDLGPEVRLEPVEIVATALELLTIPVRGPGAPADAVAGLEDQRGLAGPAHLAGGRAPGEAGSDHDDVMHGVPSPRRT
jgi:hypothetical protein